MTEPWWWPDGSGTGRRIDERRKEDGWLAREEWLPEEGRGAT
ncbi:hypothetical protein [Streptomyces sp. TRM68367]|nr:hypothetical protein [Streptomyces sp. TRM68367]